jgi:hypothetical protein
MVELGDAGWKECHGGYRTPYDASIRFTPKVGQLCARFDTWSLDSKFRARIGFQEAAHRTTEGTHWNALFLWYSRNSPESLLRCSLNPIDDTTPASIRPIEDEPLYHLAVAFGALNRFRTHGQISEKGIGRNDHTLNILLHCDIKNSREIGYFWINFGRESGSILEAI